MRAVKENKEYTIDEAQQKSYQDGGYDILDEKGNITDYGRGKTVPFEDHMRAVKEIERLQELLTHERVGVESSDAAEDTTPVQRGKKTAPKKAGE